MDTPVLSTMVVLYTTNVVVDTTKLAHELPLNDHICKIEKRGVVKRGESKRDKIKRRSKKETPSTTGFCHNSLTIVVLNDGDGTHPRKEITVKLFQNGVFHMTGILDEAYDRSVIRILLDTIATCKDSRKTTDELQILQRRVVLMNYTTKLSSNTTVAREALHTAIRTCGDEHVSSQYDPDVYPGVKIAIGSGKWTAKIFRTGKIILTGVVSHDECRELTSQLLALFAKVLPKKQMLSAM